MIAIALGALSLLAHTLPVNEIPSELFKDTLIASEDGNFGTTAVPDLADFLFKQFGHPPLTDNQILALLIGRNPFINPRHV